MESITQKRRYGATPKPMGYHFWKRVNKTETCWLWTGKTVGMGYGKFSHGTTGNVRSYRCHRLAYEWLVGPISPGLSVLHTCDTPACVNPEHLYLGTQEKNMEDKVARNRQAKGDKHWTRQHPERLIGERHPGSKITDQQVIDIRTQYKPPITKIRYCQEKAQEYGVAWGTVYNILVGKERLRKAA